MLDRTGAKHQRLNRERRADAAPKLTNEGDDTNGYDFEVRT